MHLHPGCSTHMGYGNYRDFQLNIDLPEDLPSYWWLRVRRRQRDMALDPSEASWLWRQLRLMLDLGMRVRRRTSTAIHQMRRFQIYIFVLIVIASAVLYFSSPSPDSFNVNRATHEQRKAIVMRALKEVPLVDGHNELPSNIRRLAHNNISSFNLENDLRKVEPWASSRRSQTDLPRLRAGGVGAQFWSVLAPCSAQGRAVVRKVQNQIGVILRMNERYQEHFAPATSSEDIIEAHRQGKIASLIGVEGGHSLDNSFEVLRSFYDVGVRYLTLTHKCNTIWFQYYLSNPLIYPPRQSPAPQKQGLTDAGKLLIREMNRLGMLIDLSYSSIQTMKDVLETSKAPVIFSHAYAYALCNSSDNVPDEILRMVAKNGGIVMVGFSSSRLTCTNNSTMQDVIRHINHIRDVAGVDHVGLGAGFDGISRTPVGLEDPSTYPDLFVELLRDPAWNVDNSKKLMGRNFIRVLKKAEEVSSQWVWDHMPPVH